MKSFIKYNIKGNFWTLYSSITTKHFTYAIFSRYLYLCLFSLYLIPLDAQISSGGLPRSFQYFKSSKNHPIPVYNITKSSIQKKVPASPNHFSIPIKTTISLDSHGLWQNLTDGGRVWQLKINAESAKGIAILYKNFKLAKGATLFVYSADKQQVLGAYTYANNSTSGRFMTGIIKGETAIIEYHEPANTLESSFEIFRIDYVYEMEQPDLKSIQLEDFGFGTSLYCHNNINCPLGEDWQTAKRGVCRILMVLEEGMGWCSGSLVNNTNLDETPYVLSAFHCQDGYTPLYDMWRFDFYYESPTCENPSTEPAYRSVMGCVYRSGFADTDFMLLEANDKIPSSYNVYFNGWNRSTSAPSSTTHIHHPKGDIQKISIDNNAAIIHPAQINWDIDPDTREPRISTPPNHHFRISYDDGTYEIGSSGGVLFDSNQRIVGQLHGGGIDECTQLAYFGRLGVSWDRGDTEVSRLMDWLDPINSEVITLDGLEQTVTTEMATFSGLISKEDGQSISNVGVNFTGFAIDTTIYTDDMGQFSIQLPYTAAENTFWFTLDKNNNYQDGISTFDLVVIQKHILNVETLDSPYKILAADVNNSSSVTTFDLIELRKLILNVQDSLSNVPSWRFLPTAYSFEDVTNPFNEELPAIFRIDVTDNTNINWLNFIGFKMGDANNSVD